MESVRTKRTTLTPMFAAEIKLEPTLVDNTRNVVWTGVMIAEGD